MTTDGEHGPTPPADDLQFDHAEYTAQPAAPAIACAACARPIAETYYEVGGKVLCDGCRDAVNNHFTGGSRLARFLRALVFGGLAALAGSGLYYVVRAITGYEVGLIAIVVGAMVGTAVRNGSRHRGGLVYQALAVFLTYTAIVSSYVPQIVPALFAAIEKGANPEDAAAKGDPAHPAIAPVPGEAAPAKPGVPQAKAGPDARPKPEQVSLGKAIVALALVAAIGMAFSFSAPFLNGAESPIGLLIIFFGLAQAWRLNTKVRPEIKGPFVVGPAPQTPERAPAHA